MRALPSVFAALAVTAVGWHGGAADSGSATSNGTTSASASAVDEEQELQVAEFLRIHHPELAELLTRLRSTRPKDYQRAIRELSHAHDRLSQIKQRDDAEYELELQSWVVQSRIHLVVARLTMEDTEELRGELRKLLNEQVDLKLRALQFDRARQAERLAKTDESIKKLAQTRHESVERQMQTLIKTKPAGGKKAKSAAAKPRSQGHGAGNK